jgi:hypothetical protein
MASKLSQNRQASRRTFHEQSQLCLSLRAPTRNPWLAWHWIPDVETPDPGSSPGQALIRGRDDPLPVRDDNFGFKARLR